MHVYMHVTLRWPGLIRFRRVDVWVCVFVWERLTRSCAQRMSDRKKSGGVRDRPIDRKDEFGLTPAAAALTLASMGVSGGAAVDTASDAAIAQALSTGYECYRDELLDLTNDGEELDPDYTPQSTKKIDGTDHKHKPSAHSAASAKPLSVSDKPSVSSATGNHGPTSHNTSNTRRLFGFTVVCFLCDSCTGTQPNHMVPRCRAVAAAGRFQTTCGLRAGHTVFRAIER